MSVLFSSKAILSHTFCVVTRTYENEPLKIIKDC